MAGHARQQPYAHSHAQQHRHQPESTKHRTYSTTSATNNATTDDAKSASNTPKPKLRTSCDGCQEAKLGCSQEKPTCRRCMRHGTTCVYSPFRRIGRPRKSTNPRSSTSAKSRSKNNSVDETNFASPIECLPNAEKEGSTGGITPLDTLVAPPCSPASTENDNGCGSWYPWTPDGNTLNTMNIDISTNFMEGMDPFSSTTDYLDIDSCFDTSHDMLLGYPLPSADHPTLDTRLSMQPTPPSSIDDDMSVFGESMTRSPTQNSVNAFSNHSVYQQRTPRASSSLKSTPALKSEPTFADYTDFNTFQITSPQPIKSEFMNPTSQKLKEELSDSRIPAPNSKLSPPPSSPSSCNKRCSTSLIQRLASLSKTLSDNAHPSIDVILQVERDTSSFCRQILTCATCIDHKPNHLLFSMVVDQITRLFETLSDEGTSDRCCLLVGNFQVDDVSAKAEILKRLLLSRLTSFNAMLKEFSQSIDNDLKDYNTNAKNEILREVHQRLDRLRGVIERWD